MKLASFGKVRSRGRREVPLNVERVRRSPLTPLEPYALSQTTKSLSKDLVNMPKAATTVVIPPMTGLDDGKFTCIGKGLLYDGHGREAPESLRVLLMPGAHGEAITDRSRSVQFMIIVAIRN